MDPLALMVGIYDRAAHIAMSISFIVSSLDVEKKEIPKEEMVCMQRVIVDTCHVPTYIV